MDNKSFTHSKLDLNQEHFGVFLSHGGRKFETKK